MTIRLKTDCPALIFAPMDGVADAPMREVQAQSGAFDFAVSEFQRVSERSLVRRTFHKAVPELLHGGCTPSGLPVQVQILGGHPERMAQSALVAVQAGARAVDINFGCPAPTVNRHDGGASLLKHPARIRDIVASVRDALPPGVPVSAKLRLGWDSLDPIIENALMASEGGAAWITIHGRTRVQGYQPPAYWNPIGVVRELLSIPVVANGDIWTLDDFRRCRDETGCRHFMLGRGAVANPQLPRQIAAELGLASPAPLETDIDWTAQLQRLVDATELIEGRVPLHMLLRLKQWLAMAARHGGFDRFDSVKRTQTMEELFAGLAQTLAVSTRV